MPDIPVQSGQGPNRPKSGKSAVKEKRPSLIDRFSPGGRYEPPAPTGQTVSASPQMAVVAPAKNNEVKPAAKAVAKPKAEPKKKAEAKPKAEPKKKAEAPKVDEDAAALEARKKELEKERAERDIRAYAREKARRDALKKLKK